MTSNNSRIYLGSDLLIENGGGGGGSDFIGIPRELNNGVLQMPSTPTTYTLPDGVTDIGDHAMYYAFYKCGNISTVDLSGLTTISGQDALYNAFREAGVQSVNVPNLTTITGECGMEQAFQANTNLQTIEFPKLVSVGQSGLNSTFYGCSGLTNISFPELTTIKLRGLEDAFYNCTGLTSVIFDKLSNIGADYVLSGCFAGCKSLTDVYLPALTTNSFGSSTSQFMFWLESIRNPKVHLPSNLSSVSGLTDKIQSNNGTVQVLYDLPATS